VQVIGLDIGGANIKASDGERTVSRTFPLWKSPELLSDVLGCVLERFSSESPLAVTMTGELADCFETKQGGVHFILDSLEQACPGRPMAVWCTSGEFLSIDQAKEFPTLVAAANWHALATWAGRMAPGASSLLIDIGSTTTDLIPIENGIPLPAGRTDLERLRAGELVYLGVRRTPVCTIVGEVPLRGSLVPVAREFFASSLDISLLLGEREDDPGDCETANGKPATRKHAFQRLARQICCDQEELSEAELSQIATHVRAAQVRVITAGVDQVLSRMNARPSTVLFSGEGELLARQSILNHASIRHCEDLSMLEMVGSDHSRGACAFALSRLGCEHGWM